MRYQFGGGLLFCVLLLGSSSALADDPPAKTETEATAAPAAAVAVPATSSDSTTVISGGAVEVKTGDGVQVFKPGEMPGGPGNMPPGMPGGPPGGPPGKPGEGGKKPGDKPGEAKTEEPAKPIQHPTKPPKPPKLEEFKVRPVNGKVSFNFNSQAWPDLLQWLADISDMDLDWQEMPGDYANISTPAEKSYTILEVRDLFNQLLLARGFTLLSHGKTLSVANIKKLDVSMVPRVAPEELKDRQPYEFVKVSFTLEKMTADAAVEELKPMKSPNGQLIPLKLTNRVEAIDAVVNLQEIYALLKSQQSTAVQQRSVKEFTLRYARAEEMKEQLESLLGKEKGPAMPQPGHGGQGMTPEMMQQIQQQQEMMARQGGGNPQGGQPPGQAMKPPAAQQGVSMVVNARKNSILVYAPPDKMALIDQIVETLDVPAGSQDSLLANVGRTQVYRLAGVEPETLVKTLREIGNLDPSTNLQVDKKNKAIIVFGPLADHAIIGALVTKLSGSERQFSVRRLRRLAADHVAGTVEFMINGDKKEKSNRSPYSFFDRYSSSNDSEKTATGFRVDADVEHNQLILWANEVELADVDALLRKLGEISVTEGPGMTRRIIETAGNEEGKALLQKIEGAWGSVSPNPLEIKPSQPKAKTPEAERPSEPSAMRIEKNPDSSTALAGNTQCLGPMVKPADEESGGAIVKFAQLGGESAVEQPKPKAANVTAKTPPVKAEVLPDGRIAVTSDDPQALDLFEDMAGQLSEQRKDYKVFKLKYCMAYGVALNLEEFFKNDKKKSNQNMPYWMRYEYGIDDNAEDDKSGRLSKRPSLKFITDSDTNSILVQGADAKQLQTIDELIKLYDQPLPSDAQSVRKTETIQLEYSKADAVADTVKDVYRDLLSKNDKAFGKEGGRDQNRGFFFSYDTEDDKNKEKKTPKFTGLLSIGVDEVSNTIVVSAPTYLFDQVKKMIVDLDQAAAPASQMRVIQLGPGMRGPDIRRQLLEALGQEVPKEEASAKKTPPDENGPPKTGPKKNGKGGAKNHKENA